MSTPRNLEPLARLLSAEVDEWDYLNESAQGEAYQHAEHVAAHPGSLLRALVGAGVLHRQERPYVDGGLIDGIDGWEYRYVTAWTEEG